MARHFTEARITLIGDRALAARYISEGRKYLGGVADCNTVATAVRQVVNADGVQFRVGYYGGQAFIEITAGALTEDRYHLLVNRGYVVAPRGVTYTTYSSMPATIINPFGAIDKLWGSAFFDAPESPGAGTHPTDSYIDTYSTYVKYFPELSGLVASNAARFASPRMMSWNNKDESIWLYWFGCEHGRTTHSAFAELYHNGKYLLNLNTVMEYPSMLMGVSAKRTSNGMTVFMTVIEKRNGSLHHLKLCSVKLTPIPTEMERLDKVDVDMAYGYACEYDVDIASFTELSSHQIDGSISYFSSFPHNQSVTEARGFTGITSGTTKTLYEHVINFLEPDDITHLVSVSRVITDTYTLESSCGNNITAVSTVEHIDGLSDPDAETRAPGVYTYDQNTAPHKDVKYTTLGNMMFGPDTYNYLSHKTIGDNKIKCMVDYLNDRAVYAYLVVPDEYDEREQVCSWIDSTSPSTGTLTVEVFDTFPITASQLYDAQRYASASFDTLYEKTTQIRKAGIYCPTYDDEGNENGAWLNEVHASGTYRSYTAGGQFSTVQGNIKSHTGALEGFWVPIQGCTCSRDPDVETYNTDTKDFTLSHLNLRSKTAFYRTSHDATTYVETRSFGPIVYTASELHPSYYPEFGAYERTVQAIAVSTTSHKAQTVVKHAGITVFDSGKVDTALPTTNTVTDPVTTGEYVVYGSNGVPWFQFENTSGAYANYLDEQIYNSPTPEYPGGVSPYNPDPPVSVFSTSLPPIVPPLDSSYIIRAGQPDGAIGISTTMTTYVCNVNYLTAHPSIMTALVIDNCAPADLDYMTGAHSAPWFTAPFLLSSIAVKIIKQ